MAAGKVLDIEVRGKDNGTVEMFKRSADSADALRKRMQELNITPPVKGDATLTSLTKLGADTMAIVNKTNVDRLRAEGRTLEAELALVKQSADAKKAAIDKALSTSSKRATTVGGLDSLAIRADDKRQAVDAGADAAAQQLVTRAAVSAQRELLQMRASSGDAMASAELAALNTGRQREELAKRLQGVARSDLATTGQRASAERQLVELAALREKEEGGVLNRLRLEGGTADQLKAKMKELAAAEREAAGATAAAGRAATAGGGGGGGGSSGGGGALGDLRRGLGGRSALGQIGRAIGGGGPIMGLTMFATAIGSASDKFRELNQQFREGTIDAATYNSKIVEAIPIIGQFVSAGRSLHDALAESNLGLFKEDHKEYLKGQQQSVRDIAAEQVERANDAQRARADKQQEIFRSIDKGIAADHLQAGSIGFKGYNAAAAAEWNEFGSKRMNRGDELEAKLAESKRAENAEAKRLNAENAAAAIKIQNSDVSGLVKTEKIDAIYKASADSLKHFHAERADLESKYREGDSADQQLYFYKSEAVRKEYQEKVRKLVQGFDQETAGAQSEARASILSALGHSHAVEMEQVQNHLAQLKAADAERLKLAKENATSIDEVHQLEAAAAAKSAADQAAALSAIAAKNVGTLRQGQLSLLQMKGEAGDPAALAQAKLLTQSRQDDEMKDRLQGIAGDSTASRALSEQFARQAKTAVEALNAQLFSHASIMAGNPLARAASDVTNPAADAERLAAAQQKLLAFRTNLAATEKGPAADADLRAVDALLQSSKDRLEILNQQKDAQQQLADLEQLSQLRVQKELHDQRTATLQNQAEFGATGGERIDARKSLAASKIGEELKEREAQAARILGDTAASAQDKAAAAANLQSFGANAGREYGQDVYGSERTHSTFQAEDRGLLLTGVAAAAKDHDQADPQRDIARTSADSLKVQQETLAAIKEFVRLMQAPATRAGASRGYDPVAGTGAPRLRN